MYDIKKNNPCNFELITDFGDQYSVELELIDGEYSPGEDFIISGTFEGERSEGSIFYSCKDNSLSAHLNVRMELWESLDEDDDDIEELEVEDDRYIERDLYSITAEELSSFEKDIESILDMFSTGIVETLEDVEGDLYNEI